MKFLLLITAVITPALATVAGTTSSVDCSGHTFTPAQVSAAAEAALCNLNSGTQVGSRNYPHQFGNREGFAFNSGCKPPYYEFPIFKDHVFTGGSPGADRVVVGSWNGADAVFCGGITHTGAKGNNFLPCCNF